MLTKAILICSLPTYLTNAAVIRGDNFPVFFPAVFIRSGHGDGYQQCSVGEGEWAGNVNDGQIREVSGLAYSRRSEEVDPKTHISCQ